MTTHLIRSSRATAAFRAALYVLLLLTGAMGLAFLLVLGTALFSPAELLRELAAQPEVPDPQSALAALQGAMVLSIAATVPALLLLANLLAMIDTVDDGDPFVTGNALRLRRVAWGFLAFQLLTAASNLIRGTWVSPGEGVDWLALLPGWAAVLFLFVLAQVFEQGIRLREDVEGTI